MEEHITSLRAMITKQEILLGKLEQEQEQNWRVWDNMAQDLSECRIKRERIALSELRTELGKILVSGEELRIAKKSSQFGRRVFDDDRVDNLRERLAIPLSHEDVSTRQAGGKQDVVYIETFKALEKAQEVFGFDMGMEIKAEPSILHQQGNKIVMRSIVRITLVNGCYHEDVGIGISMLSDQAEAIRMASKASVSDAIKRTLQHFGPALGSCLRDKDWVTTDLVPAVAASRGTNSMYKTRSQTSNENTKRGRYHETAGDSGGGRPPNTSVETFNPPPQRSKSPVHRIYPTAVDQQNAPRMVGNSTDDIRRVEEIRKIENDRTGKFPEVEMSKRDIYHSSPEYLQAGVANPSFSKISEPSNSTSNEKRIDVVTALLGSTEDDEATLAFLREIDA